MQRVCGSAGPDLRHTRWSGHLEGADPEYLRELVGYWAETFDWRGEERRLNAFPHFRSVVDGLRLHYVHQKADAGGLPLLAASAGHGGASADAFDVVVGSLPGFGFSEAPATPGTTEMRMAHLFHELMTRVLGYERYAVRGSDFGASVAEALAMLHPRTVAIQATKPQTLATSLNDSPAGLASWIVEKFRRWSDCDGDVERRFTKDQLLTNISVYWFTQTIGPSMRLYGESDYRQDAEWDVPTAHLMSSKDMFPTPREWIERFSRIDRWTAVGRGGHFLEWEEPRLVAEDMRAFFRALR
ncbi:epoxide hydrolase [Amycolatopsis sp. A133]|uniref:epoxide hydrolase family protein n=1 Tax=Amycolatopsis sp. A133 TaxID=3064472 RepID=UPI0027EDF061|nr:epoxide hydrolase [Amycolatopsis sp. A133]MDQ7807589.1 epoxide hydrolase [Amycolatopsis sp. A133]